MHQHLDPQQSADALSAVPEPDREQIGTQVAEWLIERVHGGAIAADVATTMVKTHSPTELGKLIRALIRQRPHESVPDAVLAAVDFLPNFPSSITKPMRGFMYHFAVAYWQQMSSHHPNTPEEE